MEIIDTQVHLNREIGIEASLFAMDAVGIDAVLIDEWSGFDSYGLRKPYRMLSNGVWRAEYPMAREAVRCYPDRFAYMARIHRSDPNLHALMEQVALDPHQLCIRVTLQPNTGDSEAFVAGQYDALFASARELKIPVAVYVPGHLDHLDTILTRFPGLVVIIDHCGICPFSPDITVENGFVFEAAARLAKEHDAVYIKLSYAPTLSEGGFPFDDLMPQLRRLIDTVGADRLMWASDYTQARRHHTWAEALLYLKTSSLLSEAEMSLIFGQTARAALNWPVTGSFGYYPRRGGDQAARG